MGDILCIMGATLYGISNIGQEYMVKTMDFRTYLAKLGVPEYFE